MKGLFDAFLRENQERQLGCFAITAAKDGLCLGEERLRPDEPYPLYSVSKSFTATAIGMAVEEGILNEDDRVLSFFTPEEVGPLAEGDGWQDMTLRHLLMMASGHDNRVEQRGAREETNDWKRLFFSIPLAYAPGKKFTYNTLGTYLLSAILTKAAGQTLLEYLKPRLFSPLGIENPRWDACPMGITQGGTGLFLRTKELLPFGQLYLDNGVYEGKRLLGEGWIRKATGFQIGTPDMEIPDKRLGYGYQFWVARDGNFRASGAHGQGVIVLKPQNAVICYHSQTTNMGGLLDAIWNHIVPQLG